MKIFGIQLWKFRAMRAEVREHQTLLSMEEMKLKFLAADSKYAPVFVVIANRDSVEKTLNLKKKKLSDFQRKMAEKFKIPLNEWGNYEINDETGNITNTEE